MDKRANRKSFKVNGDKRERIGIQLPISDKNGESLYSGDKINWNGDECIILFNKETNTWDAMICDSNWYKDQNPIDPESYGKSKPIPMDNGARMHMEKIQNYA